MNSKKQYCFYMMDEDSEINEEGVKLYKRKYNIIKHKFINKTPLDEDLE